MLNTVDICRTCEQPFCRECEADANECADGGWHCSACNPITECGHCSDDAVRELRAEMRAGR